MNVTLKLCRPTGVTKKTCHENIALGINKKLKQRELKGFIGEKYPFQKQEVVSWLEEICIERGYLKSTDKGRRDYSWFIEIILYKTIMTKYIRKDELTKDEDEKYKDNIYYYPGLVYIIGVGWIITNSNIIIERYKNQREDTLEAQKIHLDQKCHDASDFVRLLPEHHQDLLNDKNKGVM